MWKALVICLALFCVSFNAEKVADYVWQVRQGKALCGGTAIEYKSKHYVISAWHCVDQGTEITVDGNPVEIAAFNIKRDIVVLTSPKHLTKFTTIGKVPPTGTGVWIYGFPAGLFLLSHGTVSGQCGDFESMRVFPIDANIYKGNSGGPVLNDVGQVVGVISFTYPDGKWAWAVCPDEVIKLLEGIK